jgi:foldase protein PrsA
MKEIKKGANSMKIKDKAEKKGIDKVTIGISAVIAAILAIILLLYYLVIFPQTYVAKVGNEILKTQEYEYYLGRIKMGFLSQAGLQPGQDPKSEQAFWQTQAGNGGTYLSIAKSQALERSIDIKVQVIKAKELGIKIGNEDKQKLEEAIGAETKEDKAALKENLKDSFNMSFSQYRNIVKELLLIEKLKKERISTYEIFDTDIEKFYQENPSSFIRSVGVRHILVKVDMNDEEAKKKGKEKAEKILDRVNNGENMEMLVDELSEDPGKVDNKGVYSFDYKGTDINDPNLSYVSEFPEWAYSNKNIDDTGIIETSYGYHVMRLEEKDVIPLEEAKPNIKSYLEGQEYQKELDAWSEAVTVKTNDSVVAAIQ